MSNSNNKQQIQLYFDTAHLWISNDSLRHLFQGKTQPTYLWNLKYPLPNSVILYVWGNWTYL